MIDNKQNNSDKYESDNGKNCDDCLLDRDYKKGLVSVIIPSYNRAFSIGRAIQSVLDQTYKNLELIIVDDGSTDNTEEVVKDFKNPQIRYIKHKQNKGGGAARNTGIKSAKGEFIAFLDSDDQWLPSKVRKQLDIFQNSPEQTGVVFCGVYYVDYKSGKIIDTIEPDYRGDILDVILNRGSGPSLPAAVVKRECFNKAGLFDERFPSYQDADLWVRIAKLYQFDYAKECLVKFSRNHKQISTDEEARITGRELFLDKYSNLLPRLTKSKLHYMIGNAYCLQNDIKKGRINLLMSIIDYPLFMKSYLCLLISLFGSKTYRKIRENKQSGLMLLKLILNITG